MNEDYSLYDKHACPLAGVHDFMKSITGKENGF